MPLSIATTPLLAPIERRPDHWAKAISLEGVANFHQVTESLYRGAQPTAAGMRELKKLGIKTIINLRFVHSDLDEIGDCQLDYIHIPMVAWSPSEKDIIQFLRIVTDPGRLPAFVHCQHGADRTGTVIAAFRIAICNWTNQEAVDEMTRGGFGFHSVWQNLIAFVNSLKAEKLLELLAR